MRRLRTRAQFQALLGQRPVARTAHFALHRLRWPQQERPDADDARRALTALFDDPGIPWLGAMVPKRWARRAVTRNTIRRQIYALGGELLAGAAGARLIRQHAAFPKADFPSATSEALRHAVRHELQALLARESRP